MYTYIYIYYFYEVYDEILSILFLYNKSNIY